MNFLFGQIIMACIYTLSFLNAEHILLSA